MIAPLTGVAVVASPFLDQTIGLADGAFKINGQRPVTRTGPRGPGSSPAPGSPDPAGGRRKLRRKVPRVDGAFTAQPMAPAVPPVRNTSASSIGHHLSPALARPGARPRPSSSAVNKSSPGVIVIDAALPLPEARLRPGRWVPTSHERRRCARQPMPVLAVENAVA